MNPSFSFFWAVHLPKRKDSADYQDRATTRQKIGARARRKFAKAISKRAARRQRISYGELVDVLDLGEQRRRDLGTVIDWDRAPIIWHEPLETF